MEVNARVFFRRLGRAFFSVISGRLAITETVYKIDAAVRERWGLRNRLPIRYISPASVPSRWRTTLVPPRTLNALRDVEHARCKIWKV